MSPDCHCVVYLVSVAESEWCTLGVSFGIPVETVDVPAVRS